MLEVSFILVAVLVFIMLALIPEYCSDANTGRKFLLAWVLLFCAFLLFLVAGLAAFQMGVE